MKTRNINALLKSTLAIIMSLGLSMTTALAQGGNNAKTNGKILYHNGPVMRGAPNVYVIWYGTWWDFTFPGNHPWTTVILTDFLNEVGSSGYFRINAGYPDFSGEAPNGALIYGGAINDDYSHGFDLNPLSLQSIVREAILAGSFPLDPSGIYLVLSSSNVAGTAAGFCVPNAPPHHGLAPVMGTAVKYAYVGNPIRCPDVAAAHYWGQSTPNFIPEADAMASTIAAVLSNTITNPSGTGWFDRNGLESATKCKDTFGETYLTQNGARANVQLGVRPYLLQQLWVNHPRKGFCGLSAPQ